MKNQEGKKIEDNIVFLMRDKNEWKKPTAKEIFAGKRIVVFGLPGAFTPTCSSTHLPRYEEIYGSFKSLGIDEVYCISVNDSFVMNAWARAQQIEKVKMLPDGNGEFTRAIEMLVNKKDLGFGDRSWRYSAYIEDGVVKKHFIEPEVDGDPFEVSDADTMIKYLKPDIKLPKAVTIFSKEGCPYCEEAKEILRNKRVNYSEVVLSDAVRQKTLHALTGQARSTSPQVFIAGELIGGVDNLKEYIKEHSFE